MHNMVLECQYQSYRLISKNQPIEYAPQFWGANQVEFIRLCYCLPMVQDCYYQTNEYATQFWWLILYNSLASSMNFSISLRINHQPMECYFLPIVLECYFQPNGYAPQFLGAYQVEFISLWQWNVIISLWCWNVTISLWGWNVTLSLWCWNVTIDSGAGMLLLASVLECSVSQMCMHHNFGGIIRQSS